MKRAWYFMLCAKLKQCLVNDYKGTSCGEMVWMFGQQIIATIFYYTCEPHTTGLVIFFVNESSYTLYRSSCSIYITRAKVEFD